MTVVPLNITLHHILFPIFSKIQNEKKKVEAEVLKVDQNGEKSRGRLYQQFKQDIKGDKFHHQVGKGIGSANDKNKSECGGKLKGCIMVK